MDVAAPPKRTAKLGRDIQAKLGQQLRAMYDDVVNQGVPDRFAELLTRLDEHGEKEPK
ncbi:MAG TPA: NepR family anti-sigma factor [Pseudolabrys sp.]|nr:NepR family anti-sigma factor [Pseudolabrys sp.]